MVEVVVVTVLAQWKRLKLVVVGSGNRAPVHVHVLGSAPAKSQSIPTFTQRGVRGMDNVTVAGRRTEELATSTDMCTTQEHDTIETILTAV